jgi:hypothetical protein
MSVKHMVDKIAAFVDVTEGVKARPLTWRQFL